MHKMFEPALGWNKKVLPAPFNENQKVEGVKSKYNASHLTSSTIHSGICNAILRYVALENGFALSDHAAIGRNGANYVAEYGHSTGEVDLVVFNPGKASFQLAAANGDILTPMSINSKTSNHLAGLFLAILPLLLEDEEANSAYRRFEAAATGYDIPEQVNSMALLCDNIYRRITGDLFKVNFKASGNESAISKTALKGGTLAAESIFGEFQYFTGDAAEKKEAKAVLKDLDSLREKYGCPDEMWSEEEKKLIAPKSDFIIPEEVIDILDYYIGLEGEKNPQRNFTWRGETGFGKTEGTKILSYILNRPRVVINCHPMMETSEFLTQFVPVTSASSLPELELSLEDISYDPATAYQQLTGEYIEDVSAEEVFKKYLEYTAEVSMASKGQTFKVVESEFIKALSHGYIVEVMEPSIILNQGVLAGLNAYDKPGAVIPLVDGSYTFRHKDALVIYTDNVSYEGCKPMNQSVIRRNFMIIDSYNMDKNQVLERVKVNTGFDDDVILDQMYSIWHGIKEFCQSHAITDGCTSIEELTNWAKAIAIQLYRYGEMNLKKTCRQTVISKATAMVDEQEAIMAACLATIK